MFLEFHEMGFSCSHKNEIPRAGMVRMEPEWSKCLSQTEKTSQGTVWKDIKQSNFFLDKGEGKCQRFGFEKHKTLLCNILADKG